MLVYEFETGSTAVRFMHNGPAGRDLDEARPKGILPFFVDKDMIDTVFVFKWVGHVVLLEA
jgi:hypothetical protein